MSNQQTLQQQRAKQANTDVNEVVYGNTSNSEYKSVIRSFPALIQTDGLATALAFLKAKGKDHHEAAYKHVSNWVMARVAHKDEMSLLDWVQEASTFEYRQATAEALAYTAWLKRFVEAKISKD